MALTGPATSLGIRTFADGDSPDLAAGGLTLALNDVDALLAALGGYQELTTDQATSSSTDVDLVTFAAATFAAVRHYLEIAIPNLRQTGVGNSIYFLLKEGASVISDVAQVDAQTIGNGLPVFLRLPFTPAPAGAHTYKVAWKVSTGTATIRTTGLLRTVFRIVRAN